MKPVGSVHSAGVVLAHQQPSIAVACQAETDGYRFPRRPAFPFEVEARHEREPGSETRIATRWNRPMSGSDEALCYRSLQILWEVTDGMGVNRPRERRHPWRAPRLPRSKPPRFGRAYLTTRNRAQASIKYLWPEFASPMSSSCPNFICERWSLGKGIRSRFSASILANLAQSGSGDRTLRVLSS